MNQIGYFGHLGIGNSDISDLVRLTSNSKDALRPNTRDHVYRGTLQGIPIVIKPFASESGQR